MPLQNRIIHALHQPNTQAVAEHSGTVQQCASCKSTMLFQGVTVDASRHAMVGQWLCPNGH